MKIVGSQSILADWSSSHSGNFEGLNCACFRMSLSHSWPSYQVFLSACSANFLRYQMLPYLSPSCIRNYQFQSVSSYSPFYLFHVAFSSSVWSFLYEVSVMVTLEMMAFCLSSASYGSFSSSISSSSIFTCSFYSVARMHASLAPGKYCLLRTTRTHLAVDLELQLSNSL